MTCLIHLIFSHCSLFLSCIWYKCFKFYCKHLVGHILSHSTSYIQADTVIGTVTANCYLHSGIWEQMEHPPFIWRHLCPSKFLCMLTRSMVLKHFHTHNHLESVHNFLMWTLPQLHIFFSQHWLNFLVMILKHIYLFVFIYLWFYRILFLVVMQWAGSTLITVHWQPFLQFSPWTSCSPQTFT